jgi:hypothetical protein
MIVGRLRAMKPVHIYIAAALVMLAGCRSSSTSPVLGPLISYDWSERLMSREIHLSPKHPADPDTRIRLVAVGGDSTATIRLDSGQLLTAKPGEYFACEQFGLCGLQLVSASAETGATELKQTWCETR